MLKYVLKDMACYAIPTLRMIGAAFYFCAIFVGILIIALVPVFMFAVCWPAALVWIFADLFLLVWWLDGGWDRAKKMKEREDRRNDLG